MATNLERLEAEQSLRSRIGAVRERLLDPARTGRDRALDLDLSLALHGELAALEAPSVDDQRKAAEDAAALVKSQTWLEEKRAVVVERDRLRAVLKNPTALPDDREAASAALAALPRAW
jgi:hypothetical protein